MDGTVSELMRASCLFVYCQLSESRPQGFLDKAGTRQEGVGTRDSGDAIQR
jgi:hypothetical protein